MSLTDLTYVKERLARLEERIRQVCADFRIVRKRCDDDFVNDIWNALDESRKRIVRLEKENIGLRRAKRLNESEVERLEQRLRDADVPLDDDPTGMRYHRDEPVVALRKQLDAALAKLAKLEGEK